MDSQDAGSSFEQGMLPSLIGVPLILYQAYARPHMPCVTISAFCLINVHWISMNTQAFTK